MRFKNWQPTVGERALVPGGPGNAAYVDALTAEDVAAILAGHRGYAPLRFYVISKIELDYGRIQPGEALELVYYDYGAWLISKEFRRWNRLDRLMAEVRFYYGLGRGDYELTTSID